MVNQTVGSIAVVAVFLNGVLVINGDPEDKAADGVLGGEVMADQGGAKTAGLKFRGDHPIANGGSEALSFVEKERGQSAFAFDRQHLAALDCRINFVGQRDLIRKVVEGGV